MQRFKFSLENLLKVRRRHEEQTQLHLSRSIKLLTDAQLHLEALAQYADTTREEWQQALGEKKRIEDFILYSSYLDKLTVQYDLQQIEVEKAAQFNQECLLAYSEALKNRKIVERLKEKKQQQHYYEMLAEEQKFLDEIGTQRYHREM